MPIAIGQLTITDVQDGIQTEIQYASNTSLTTAPTTGWGSTVPAPSTGYYVWRRERIAYPDGTFSAWNAVRVTGEEGIQGPPGNPGQLGIYADGDTLHVKGFAEDGTLTASQGYIYVGDSRITVPAYSQQLIGEGQGYVVWDGTSVQFAKMQPQQGYVEWLPYNGGTAFSPAYIIGKFTKDGATIYDASIFSPTSTDSFNKNHFMEILAGRDSNQFESWVEALGVEQFFESIAVLDAFVNRLTANNIEIISVGGLQFQAMKDINASGEDNPIFKISYNGDRLFEVDPVSGKIYFGDHFWYDPQDKAIKSTNNKIVIGADGTLHAEDGIFSGTVNASNGKFSGDLDISPSSGKLLQLLSSLGTLLQWTTSTYTNGQALYNALSAQIAPNMNFTTTGTIQIQTPGSVSMIANTTSDSAMLGIIWLSESTAIGYKSAWTGSAYQMTFYKSTDYGATWVQKAQVDSYLKYASWSTHTTRWITLSPAINEVLQITSDGTIITKYMPLKFRSADGSTLVDFTSGNVVRNACVYRQDEHYYICVIVEDPYGTNAPILRVALAPIESSYPPYYAAAYPIENVNLNKSVFDGTNHVTSPYKIFVVDDNYQNFKVFAKYYNIINSSVYYFPFSSSGMNNFDDNSIVVCGRNVHFVHNNVDMYMNGFGQLITPASYQGSASDESHYVQKTGDTTIQVRPDSTAMESIELSVPQKIKLIFLSGGQIRILARAFSTSGSTYSHYQISMGAITSITATKFQYKKYGSGSSEKIVIRLNDSNTQWVSILFSEALATTANLTSTGIGKIENFDYIEATTVYGARFN